MSEDYQEGISKALVKAANNAAKSLSADFRELQTGGITPGRQEKTSHSGLPDFVTNADLKSQSVMAESLTADFSDIPFYGEEGGGVLPASGAYFLVDPLDGTSNFIAGRPYFSMTLSYIEDGIVQVAVIADPMTGSYIGAVKGRGLFRGALGEADSVSFVPVRFSENLESLQLECEFPLLDKQEIEIVGKLLPNMSGLRKSGSTALDIFHQVTGYKSAIVSSCLQAYDIAACVLIASEAGFVVTDLDGNPASLYSDSLICARPEAHQEILRLIL